MSSSLTLKTGLDIDRLLSPISRVVGERIGDPWKKLIWHINNHVEYYKHKPGYLHRIGNDVLASAIDFEPPVTSEGERLWRTNIGLDSARELKMRATGNDYAFLMDLNDAIWRLMVRLFLWTEAEVKIT